eukprot:2137042-Pleurochrysis_carterae.AAC.1
MPKPRNTIAAVCGSCADGPRCFLLRGARQGDRQDRAELYLLVQAGVHIAGPSEQSQQREDQAQGGQGAGRKGCRPKEKAAAAEGQGESPQGPLPLAASRELSNRLLFI